MTILKFNDLKKKESFHSKMDYNHIISTQNNDQIILSKDKKTVIHCPKCFKGSFEIPKGVEIIGIEAFAGCKELKSVTISESVRKIEMFAFKNCIRLSRIIVKSNLPINVDEDAFENRIYDECILKIPINKDTNYYKSIICKTIQIKTRKKGNKVIEQIEYNHKSLKQVI